MLFLKKWYNEFQKNRKLDEEKSRLISLSRAFEFDENLKKHTQALRIISNNLNSLFYELPEKSTARNRFVQLITLRIRDYYVSLILLFKAQQYQSSISILRAICETLFLLKYVQLQPEYINQFMEKTGRGKELKDLRKTVNDAILNDFYKKLSDFLHPNPFGIKYTYYEVPGSQHIIISQIPLNYKEFDDEVLMPFIGMMQESIRILYEIKKE
jgi:hypothetical protein